LKDLPLCYFLGSNSLCMS